MSNLGLRILYELINAEERFAAERVFSPWEDMRKRMTETEMPLFSLETRTPIADFDLLGISLQSELTFTNVLGLLDAAGLPRRSSERTALFPLVIAGGPCAFNPEPLAPFIDIFAIGEAEELIIEVLDRVADYKAAVADGPGDRAERQALLEDLAGCEGIYVPTAIPQTRSYPLLRADGSQLKIRKRLIKDLDGLASPERPIVPFLETIHDRCVIEVMRGCVRGCRFCQAGIIYRPARERTASTVLEAALVQSRHTGYDDLSLSSLSTTDHSQLLLILERAASAPANYLRSISLPSMRTDRFSVEVADMIAGRKRTGLTFAPEAGTARLRAVINKGLSEADILDAARQAFKAGWQRIKLYFMIGLPSETDEDVIGITELVDKVLAAAAEELGPKRAKRVLVVVSVSTFVPKPHTPFQWVGALPLVEIERRQRLLRARLPRKRAELKWHESGSSIVEAALARGGRETARAIERAYDLGAEFDGWSDNFSLDIWERAFQEVGLDLEEAATAELSPDTPLPWSHIDCGIDFAWLRTEYERALAAEETPDCRYAACSDCGVCGAGVKLEIADRKKL